MRIENFILAYKYHYVGDASRAFAFKVAGEKRCRTSCFVFDHHYQLAIGIDADATKQSR
jgi:hypothetical protein